MAKVAIGARTLLYPLPTVLVGANIDGKPNFSAYAWCGIVNSRPPMLSVAFQHQHYTLKGVKQNGTFSVNIPSVELVKEADYCGIVSGRDTDKVADCKFNIFYGKLASAPLISECPTLSAMLCISSIWEAIRWSWDRLKKFTQQTHV